jgi:apolipoprotein N-acyltransferase
VSVNLLQRRTGEIAALGAGAALPLAFAPFNLYPLAILLPAVLFASWRGVTPARAFVRGGLFGLGMFAVGVSWVFISMNDYGGMGVAMSAAITAALVIAMSVFPALAGYTAVRLCGAARAAAGNLPWLLIFPGVWTLFEWARGRFLTGFPWLNLGYSQIDGPLSGFAPLVGVYGISLMAALSAACLLAAVGREGGSSPPRRWVIALAMIWLTAAGLRLVDWTHPAGEPVRVSLVQGNVAQDMKWEPGLQDVTVELYTELTRAHWDSKLIVWPETAMPMYYLQARPYLDVLAEEARRHGSTLLAGLVYLDPDTNRYYNTMITVGEREEMYHKHHLVPFTEYLPFKSALGGLIDTLNIPMSDFTAGNLRQPPLDGAGQKLGMSICYEDAFGEEMIGMLPQATLLVNVSDDAWFGGSLAPAQHLQIARMRAAETGRYLVRATNTGLTAVIGPSGRLQSIAPQFERTVLSDSVQPMQGTTPYVVLGNWPVLVLAGVMVLCGTAYRVRGLTWEDPPVIRDGS